MFTNLFGSRTAAKPTYKNISPTELMAMVEGVEDVYLLDVRSAEEYAQFHIAGSHLLPLFTVSLRHQEIPAGKPIAVICRSGARSGMACEQLIQLGHKNLMNLNGGLIAWHRDDLPLVMG